MAMISLSQIQHTYSSAERAVHALRGVTLDIDSGEFLAITGPSGCGKSTLLNIIATLDRPSSGHYLFQGQDTAAMSSRQLARFRATKVGLIFQNFNLIDGLSVYENIELGLLYRGEAETNLHLRVQEAMDQVGIGHRARHHPSQLSGGQQQRCAIARAIVGRPDVILADEPTGNLDSQGAAQILGILRALNGAGTTLVMVTHSLTQADQADRVVEMLDGRIHLTSRRLGAA